MVTVSATAKSSGKYGHRIKANPTVISVPQAASTAMKASGPARERGRVSSP